MFWIIYFPSIFVIFYFTLYRNTKVFKFRLRINDAIHQYNSSRIYNINSEEFREGLNMYRKLPSYSKMCYSFKPLKYRIWIPEDVYEKIRIYLIN